jgi:hypothetical protein
MKHTLLTTTVVAAILMAAPSMAGTSIVPNIQKHTKKFSPKKAPTYVMTDSACLTINTFKEANTATQREQRLVNHVVLNRVSILGGTACGQIFKPHQFSWTDGVVRKDKFNSESDMLAYYKVDAKSFHKLEPIVADVLLEHSVTSFTPTMYHDKTVKNFGKGVNPKKVKVLVRTKNFVWYTTNDLANQKKRA